MFIITLKDNEDNGAYAIVDEFSGDKILVLFEEEDDAKRYAMLLEDNDYCEDELNVTEVPEEIAIKTCKRFKHKYTIITQDDIVVPPKKINAET